MTYCPRCRLDDGTLHNHATPVPGTNVERLHEFINSTRIIGGSNPDAYRAREWLHALAADLDAATRERDLWERATSKMDTTAVRLMGEAYERAEAAEQAMDAANETLREIRDRGDYFHATCESHPQNALILANMARRALEQ